MTFREQVEADIHGVFLNADEFAEIHTVKYDGDTYEDIPVVLTKVKQSEHTVIPADTKYGGVDGIHVVSVIAHIAQSDMDGRVPEQEQILCINDGFAAGLPYYRKYRIVTSDAEMGMLRLELEAFDE